MCSSWSWDQESSSLRDESASSSNTTECTETAVDRKDHASHERCRVAAEVLDRGVELIGPAESAHRSMGDDGERASRERPVGVEEHRAILIGDEEPRCDRVDAHAF